MLHEWNLLKDKSLQLPDFLQWCFREEAMSLDNFILGRYQHIYFGFVEFSGRKLQVIRGLQEYGAMPLCQPGYSAVKKPEVVTVFLC